MIAMTMTSPPPSELNGGGSSSAEDREGTPSPPPMISAANVTAASAKGGNVDEVEERERSHRRPSFPGYSGLSALIQAATSQLGHLIDVEIVDDDDNNNEGQREDEKVTSRSATGTAHETVRQSIDKHLTSLASKRRGDSGQLRLRELKPNGFRDTSKVTFAQQPRSELTDNPNSAPGMGHPCKETEPDPSRHSFPELLMALSMDPRNQEVITFLPDGKFFAVRSIEFAETLMDKYFAVSTFEEFLELADDWGFSRVLIAPNSSDPLSSLSISSSSSRAAAPPPPKEVEVFRHPFFVRSEWEMCARIKFGESPTSARVSALKTHSFAAQIIESAPPQPSLMPAPSSPVATSPINRSASADEGFQGGSAEINGSCANTKRRLSPGFLNRRESESIVSSQKQRMRSPDAPRDNADSENDVDSVRSPPLASSVIVTAPASASSPPDNPSRRTDDLRSIALSITTEKLRIRSGELHPPTTEDHPAAADVLNPSRSQARRNSHPDPEANKTNLVDQAVESATHAVVTDAIETLLKDEDHTKRTYLKHEEQLGVSTIRGVVPISKQLFSPEATSLAAVSLSISSPAPSLACAPQHPPPPPVPFSSPDKPAEITPPLEPQEALNNPVVPVEALEALSYAAAATEKPSTDKNEAEVSLKSCV